MFRTKKSLHLGPQRSLNPPLCPWAVQSCTSEHLAMGGAGLTHLSWNFFSPPSMLRLQIAITSVFGFFIFFFFKKKVPVQVYVLFP